MTKLLIDAGNVCAAFHDEKVRNVPSSKVQCDEIWSFSYAKAKNVRFAKSALLDSGDVWTWTGIDADSKLIVSWHVGDRSMSTGTAFMGDLKARLAHRVQLTTDGHRAYLGAVSEVDFDADYAMLNKIFATDYAGPGRYSPPKCIGAVKQTIMGNPDPEHINTSFAERQNLTMRMSMRRFTRLTNAFSKKFENHCHALALYFFSNFCRVHKTLGATPAMASGLCDHVMRMADCVALIDAANPVPAVRGPYKNVKMLNFKLRHYRQITARRVRSRLHPPPRWWPPEFASRGRQPGSGSVAPTSVSQTLRPNFPISWLAYFQGALLRVWHPHISNAVWLERRTSHEAGRLLNSDRKKPSPQGPDRVT